MLGIRTGAKRVTLALTLLIAFAVLGILFSSHDPSPAATSSPPPPPRSLSSYGEDAMAKWKANDLHGAMAELSEGISHYPDAAPLYNMRGLLQKNLGTTLDALRDFDRAIRLDPKLAAAYNNRGMAYSADHQHRRAIEDYFRAIQLRPLQPTVWINRAKAYAKINDRQKAIHDFRKALELAPPESRYAYEAWNGLKSLGVEGRTVRGRQYY